MSLLPSSIFHYVVTLQLRASSNTLIRLHEFNCACMSASLFLLCKSVLFVFSLTLSVSAAAGNTVHLQLIFLFFISFLFYFLDSSSVCMVHHIIQREENISFGLSFCLPPALCITFVRLALGRKKFILCLTKQFAILHNTKHFPKRM